MRLTWVIPLMFTLLGCAANTRLKAEATTAIAVSAGYRALDAADMVKVSEIHDEIAKDPKHAQADLDAWKKSYAIARAALDAGEAIVKQIDANPTDVAADVATLTKVAADIAKALHDAGVTK